MFDPQKEDSIVRQLGRAAVGPLAAVGNVLGLPGSMVTDVLAGEHPFDQILTPTQDINRTSGKQLLQKYGVLSKKESAGNTIAGLAADVVTDPLTYLTLGTKSALTTAGKALHAADGVGDLALAASKQAGRRVGAREALTSLTLNDAVTHLNHPRFMEVMKGMEHYATTNGYSTFGDFLTQHGNDRLAGVATVGIPFTKDRKILGLGTQRTVDAARKMDTLEEAVKYGRYSYPVRAARGLFDPRVGGERDVFAHKANEINYAFAKRADVKVRKSSWKLANDLDTVQSEWTKNFGDVIDPATGLGAVHLTRDLVEQAVRHADEVKDVSRGVAKYGTTPVAGANLATLHSAMQQAIDSTHALRDDLKRQIATMGGNTAIIDSPEFAHAPRYQDRRTQMMMDQNPYRFGRGAQSQMARNPVIKMIPADITKDILIDPRARIRGTPTTKQLDDLVNAYRPYLESSDPATIGQALDSSYRDVSLAHQDNLRKWAGDLMRWSTSHSDKFAADVASGKAKWFGNLYGTDVETYFKQMHRVHAHTSSIHELFRRNVLGSGPLTIGGTTMQPNLREAFTQHLKMPDPDQAMHYFAKEIMGITPQAAENLVVHPEAISAAAGLMNMMGNKEWFNTVTEAVDSFNRMFKTHVTFPFPAFHVRNFTSGQYMNMASGEIQTPAELLAYSNELMGRTRSMMKPEAVNDPAMRDAMQRLYEYDVVTWGFDPDHTIRNAFTEQKRRGVLLPGNPLNIKSTYAAAAQDVAKNPLEMFGHTVPIPDKVRAIHGTMIGTGAKANERVEFMNRAAMFNYLVDRKGWTPEVAARRVKELHTDWSDLAPFEKDVMRRLVPFYSFTRRMLGETAKNLVHRPGGLMAQTIKATARMRGSDATTPDYVASTTSIPLGEMEGGGHRYLTGLGLAHEDPLSFGGLLAGDLQGSLLEGLSRTTPLIKAPAEWAFGESAFQRGASGGRDISDLDPVLGRIGANFSGKDSPYRLGTGLEFALANSPLSRFLSTTRTLSDPRKGVLEKGLNTLTGFRVTDVSPSSEDAILREHAQKALKNIGSKAFVRSYIPEERMADLSPEVRVQAERLDALMKELAKRSRERKKQRELDSQKVST